MKLRVLFFSAIAAASLSACIVTPYGAYADVAVRPPAPRVVVEPVVRPGYVYAPGYWRWNGRSHIWVDGRYMREHRGYRWAPAHWEERGSRWHFEEGHWAR